MQQLFSLLVAAMLWVEVEAHEPIFRCFHDGAFDPTDIRLFFALSVGDHITLLGTFLGLHLSEEFRMSSLQLNPIDSMSIENQ